MCTPSLALLALAFVFVLTAERASAQQPDLTAAQALRISGPVTVEQGAAIAARHAGGPARLIEEETEDGGVILEFAVETASGPLEVEVRERDGAVLEVEPADEDDGEDDDAEDEGEDDKREDG